MSTSTSANIHIYPDATFGLKSTTGGGVAITIFVDGIERVANLFFRDLAAAENFASYINSLCEDLRREETPTEEIVCNVPLMDQMSEYVESKDGQ